MIVWDTSTKPPVLITYCDECGQVCDNDCDLDGKHYCNQCLAMFNAMNDTGVNEDEG